MLSEKSRHNNVHTVNFHSYEVPELAKIIYDDRNKNGVWMEGMVIGKEMGHLCKVMEMFDIWLGI